MDGARSHAKGGILPALRWCQDQAKREILPALRWCQDQAKRRILPALEKLFTVLVMERRGRGASGDAASYEIGLELANVASAVNDIAPRIGTSVPPRSL